MLVKKIFENIGKKLRNYFKLKTMTFRKNKFHVKSYSVTIHCS